jgi:hypothetical protein
MRDKLLEVFPQGIRTVLDLGCRDCWHTAGLPGVKRHVGVDAWPPALERGKEKAAGGHIPNFEPVLADALVYLQERGDDAFDAVLAIDLLEHLEEAQGLRLLDEMVRVAGKIAIVWTTLGLIQQGPVDVDGNPNPFEEHKWGPRPSQFVERGWHVRSFPLWHKDRGGAILAWRSK